MLDVAKCYNTACAAFGMTQEHTDHTIWYYGLDICLVITYISVEISHSSYCVLHG